MIRANVVAVAAGDSIAEGVAEADMGTGDLPPLSPQLVLLRGCPHTNYDEHR